MKPVCRNDRRQLARGRQYPHRVNSELSNSAFNFCGWFTEGFDTCDLKEAKALLEELAA
jgi:hypothetical protein